MSTPTVDVELVRALAALLDDARLTEIEYAKADLRVRVVRAPPVVTVGAAPTAAAAAPLAAGPPTTGPGEVPAGAVTSPMVGTVYVASQPGAAPLVREGERVRAGQTLLIIEAMKVMNPLPAPRDGTIERMLVRDGQPVEFGEPLLILA
jgi:acetyl-CoA carboxylase biotin carboxyl carrier protein